MRHTRRVVGTAESSPRRPTMPCCCSSAAPGNQATDVSADGGGGGGGWLLCRHGNQAMGVVVVEGGLIHVGLGEGRWGGGPVVDFHLYFCKFFICFFLAGIAGKPSIYSAAAASAAAAGSSGLPRSRDACHALRCRRGGGTGSLRWLARHPGTSKKTKS